MRRVAITVACATALQIGLAMAAWGSHHMYKPHGDWLHTFAFVDGLVLATVSFLAFLWFIDK